jgi:hypothetical protein
MNETGYQIGNPEPETPKRPKHPNGHSAFVRERVVELRNDGLSYTRIAEELTSEGLRRASGKSYTQADIANFLRKVPVAVPGISLDTHIKKLIAAEVTSQLAKRFRSLF